MVLRFTGGQELDHPYDFALVALYEDGRVTQALELDHHLNRLATDKLRLDTESAGIDALPPIRVVRVIPWVVRRGSLPGQ